MRAVDVQEHHRSGDTRRRNPARWLAGGSKLVPFPMI